jgi:hypothetical protein
MSPLKIMLAAASMAALCGAAFAASDGSAGQHGWQKPSPEQMAAWHARMCNDMYARKAGKLAYLQAALSITDTQRGAFDQWRDAELSAAKEHSSACLAHTPGQAHEHDALTRNMHEEKMLEMRLADLKSEQPALEALYQSLSPEQKQVFDHADHGGHHHGHHEMGQRFGERGEHGDGHDRAPG